MRFQPDAQRIVTKIVVRNDKLLFRKKSEQESKWLLIVCQPSM